MERESFEIANAYSHNAKDSVEYITVLDKFYHHYTKETMRYIRIEFVLPVSMRADAHYTIVDEKEWKGILARRIGGRK